MAQRTTINYRDNAALNADLKEVLAEFDLTKTGTVTTSELVAGAEALREVRGQNVFMKKAAGVLALMLVLLLAGMFGVTMVAVELTRETKVLNAKLVTPDGSPVQVASSDFVVAANGELQRRPEPGAVDGRPLGGKQAMVVTAGPKRALQVGALLEKGQSDDGSEDLEDFEVTPEFVEELLSALEAAPDTRMVLGFDGAGDGRQSELAGGTGNALFTQWKRLPAGTAGVLARGSIGGIEVIVRQGGNATDSQGRRLVEQPDFGVRASNSAAHTSSRRAT